MCKWEGWCGVFSLNNSPNNISMHAWWNQTIAFLEYLCFVPDSRTIVCFKAQQIVPDPNLIGVFEELFWRTTKPEDVQKHNGKVRITCGSLGESAPESGCLAYLGKKGNEGYKHRPQFCRIYNKLAKLFHWKQKRVHTGGISRNNWMWDLGRIGLGIWVPGVLTEREWRHKSRTLYIAVTFSLSLHVNGE